jgi:hypothetical protein
MDVMVDGLKKLLLMLNLMVSLVKVVILTLVEMDLVSKIVEVPRLVLSNQ